MTLHEKIKWINKGMALQRRVDGTKEPATCGYYEAFKDMLAQPKRIQCKAASDVEIFKVIISTLGLDEYIDYTIQDNDGELEIVIGGKEE